MVTSTHRKKGGGLPIYLSLLYLYATIGRQSLPFHVTTIPATLLRSSTQVQVRTNTEHRTRNERSLVVNDERMVDAADKERMRNNFLIHFANTLSNNKQSTSNFAALILRNDKDGRPRVYCRKSHVHSLARSKYYVQMLQQGLEVMHKNTSQTIIPLLINFNTIFLPILIKHDDSNGCYPHTQTDKYGFPRLTWSIPASSTSSSWCSAIGMPSYKVWKDIMQQQRTNKVKDSNNLLQNVKNNTAILYPWKTKVPMAVWRGSTTCNKAIYGHLPLELIPRSKVAQLSIDRPDLIDAAFHKLVGKYNVPIANNNSSSSSNVAKLKESIPLNEMMRYKAIIDIDGNNWSARFPFLLCTNSIIIRIKPDFVEQQFTTAITTTTSTNAVLPNVHYLPATISNLTSVIEHAMNIKNDIQIQHIVQNANGWCKQQLTKDVFIRNTIDTLVMYQKALVQHGVIENDGSRGVDDIDDLVECNV